MFLIRLLNKGLLIKFTQYHSTAPCFLADMHRTFPDNILFRSRAEPSLQRALYNVLLAYGHHNKAVGYCQVKKTASQTMCDVTCNLCLPEERDWLARFLCCLNTCEGFSRNIACSVFTSILCVFPQTQLVIWEQCLFHGHIRQKLWRGVRTCVCCCLFQGMNFIAGYLIIITKDEEKSFWLMDALLGKMLPGNSFSL